MAAGSFRLPRRQFWADIVYKTDEPMILAEVEIEVEVEGKAERPKIGAEVFIPTNSLQTLPNVG